MLRAQTRDIKIVKRKLTRLSLSCCTYPCTVTMITPGEEWISWLDDQKDPLDSQKWWKGQLAGNPLYSLNLFKHNKHGFNLQILNPWGVAGAVLMSLMIGIGWAGQATSLGCGYQRVAWRPTWGVSNAVCVKGHGSASFVSLDQLENHYQRRLGPLLGPQHCVLALGKLRFAKSSQSLAESQ